MGSYSLTGTEFPLGMMKKLWRRAVMMAVARYECTNVTELYTYNA